MWNDKLPPGSTNAGFLARPAECSTAWSISCNYLHLSQFRRHQKRNGINAQKSCQNLPKEMVQKYSLHSKTRCLSLGPLVLWQTFFRAWSSDPCFRAAALVVFCAHAPLPNPTGIHLRSQQSPEVELSWPLCEHMKAQYHFGRIWQHRVTTRNKKVSHLLHWRWQNIFTTWENEWITGRPLLMMFYARHRSKQPVDISVFAPVWYLTHVELLHNAHLKLRMAWNYSTAFVHSVRIITNVEKYISGSYHWCHLGMCYIATCLSFLHSSYRNSLKKADTLPGAAAASKLRSSSSTSAVRASRLGDTANTTSQVNLNPASMIPLWFKSILLNSCGSIQQILVPIKTVWKNRASTQLLNGFKPCETLLVNLVIFSLKQKVLSIKSCSKN